MFFEGEIRGGDGLERAIALAGVLAEQGARSLAWRAAAAAGEVTLNARETDLPGLISGAKEETMILWRERDLEVAIGAAALAWRTSDGELASALRGVVVTSR
jgi:hypothetical protein